MATIQICQAVLIFKFSVLTFLRFMSCSMSIEQKLCSIKYFNSNLCPMPSYLYIKGLWAKILVYRVWPWLFTWAIWERQSCTQKIGSRTSRLQCAKMYNFLASLIQTHDLVVKVSCSELGYIVLILVECWNSLLPLSHFVCGSEPVSALTWALYIDALSITFSWIWSSAGRVLLLTWPSNSQCFCARAQTQRHLLA